METLQSGDIKHYASHRALSAAPSGAVRPDQYHRVQVCTIVFDLLSAARCGQVAEYLKPIPITHLNVAERAFREIGAIRIASALHATQFGLTRVGIRTSFAQAVTTLTAALESRCEDVDQLVANYSRGRITAPVSR